MLASRDLGRGVGGEGRNIQHQQGLVAIRFVPFGQVAGEGSRRIGVHRPRDRDAVFVRDLCQAAHPTSELSSIIGNGGANQGVSEHRD